MTDLSQVIALDAGLERDWPILALISGVLAGLVAFYTKIREFVIMVSGDLSHLIARRQSFSKRAGRRARFADYLESAMRQLAEQEEWRDSRFADLEAEVELEREPSFAWLRRRFGRVQSRRIHRVPSLTAALRERKQARLIVLEGDPGAGKSVALRHLTQDMALRASRRSSERTVLPIYVNLKTFRPPAGRPVSSEDVRKFILEYLNPSESRDIDRFLADEFDSGREDGLWLFLFDSFDEIPAILGALEAGPIIDQYADAIAGFIGMGKSRGVIASREFRGPSRLGWPRFRIMPLTRKRRISLIQRADLEEQVEKSLIEELGTLESSMQQLADNPLFLSLVCEYVRDEKAMPETIHGVLESYVMSRLTRDQERIESRFAITVGAIRAFAEEMAFQMLSSPELGLSVSRSLIVERVAGHLGQDPDEAAAAVDALIYSKLVRVSRGEASRPPGDIAVAFSHRRLHEYFATCVVINERGRVRPVELLTNGRWRETAVAVLQTQRPEDSAELLAEAERLFRASLATSGGESPATQRPWQPGVLHMLDLLANGLKPQRLTAHPIGALVGEILDIAWQNGDRLDKKWAVELCAAAGTERMIDYLMRAFDTESLWLRNQAYAQVRRIGTAATRLEPHIRQMLIDMSIGGTLRRERNSVRAQLMRLSNPAPLRRVIQLVLAAPIVAAIAGSCMGVFFATPNGSEVLGAPGGLETLAVVVLVIVPPVFLRRFALISNSRAQRYARRHLARFGLDRGVEVKFFASLLSGMILLFTIVAVSVFVLVAVDYELTSMAVILGALGWVVCWSHAALFVAANGAWTGRRYWPILPFFFFRAIIVFARKNVKGAVFFIIIQGIGMSGAFVLAHFTEGSHSADLWIQAIIYTMGGLLALSFTLKTLRQAWGRRSDYRAVSALARPDGEPNSVPDIQRTLEGLRTDQGIQILLHYLRKHRLQRTPEVADFLAFLGQRLEKAGEENDEPDDTRDQPGWVEWWNGYRPDDLNAPLRHPSSETLDELGNILEDAQRTAAFRS